MFIRVHLWLTESVVCGLTSATSAVERSSPLIFGHENIGGDQRRLAFPPCPDRIAYRKATYVRDRIESVVHRYDLSMVPRTRLGYHHDAPCLAR